MHGISATPRTLVVIGRSATLTEPNRRKLAVMQGGHPGLSIMTYDELIDRARGNFERQLGPLSFRAQNLKIYYYRHDPGSRHLDRVARSLAACPCHWQGLLYGFFVQLTCAIRKPLM